MVYKPGRGSVYIPQSWWIVVLFSCTLDLLLRGVYLLLWVYSLSGNTPRPHHTTSLSRILRDKHIFEAYHPWSPVPRVCVYLEFIVHTTPVISIPAISDYSLSAYTPWSQIVCLHIRHLPLEAWFCSKHTLSGPAAMLITGFSCIQVELIQVYLRVASNDRNQPVS